MNQDSATLILDWYTDFLAWMRGRKLEVLEIVSDCSNELFLNALTAQHMRVYGRKKKLPLFWARSEWYKVDVSFGQATERFANWNQAWHTRGTGDLGLIEAKLTYSTQASSGHKEAFKNLLGELEARKKGNAEQSLPQEYLSLVWHYRYKPGKQVSDEEWVELFGDAGLDEVICPDTESADTAGFVSIGEIDLQDIWPKNYDCHGELLVSLRRWNSVPE